MLSCTTYLATSGGDSSISIWKTGEKHPFFIIKKAFLAGVNDLTWGLEGNVLFGCSNDGEVMACHFLPGTLGEFVSEREKQQIVLSNYGEIVYNEYKKNSRINVVKQPIEMPGQNADTEKKQITSEGKLAKKRIIPIAEKTFSSELDPHTFRFKFNEFKGFKATPSPPKKKGYEEMKIMLPQANSNNDDAAEVSKNNDVDMQIETQSRPELPKAPQVKPAEPEKNIEQNSMEIDSKQAEDVEEMIGK